MVCSKSMNEEMAVRPEDRVEVTRRFIQVLQAQVVLAQADSDGRLRETAKILLQKRGCRR